MRPLLTRFPQIASYNPVIQFGKLPTPVHRLDGLCHHLKRSNLYIKRDDLSGEHYGGNKVRKLEFLLADAKKSGATRIITSGAAGSNHALATAIYARQCGFKVTLMLFDQPWNPAIPATLLADFSTGADMYLDAQYADHVRHIASMIDRYEHDDGKKPYCIPAGGSSAIGVAGYVNAALELKAQIDDGLLPEPYAIYCALGTMGTAAGLLLGIRAAGIKSHIVAVRVVPPVVANYDKLVSLYDDSNRILSQIDHTFPHYPFNSESLHLSESFFGEGYGITTPEALAAIETLKKTDDISLDPVYTGKTATAFLTDAARQELHDKTLLYLHTKSSNFPDLDIKSIDFHQLPPPFHDYFSKKSK